MSTPYKPLSEQIASKMIMDLKNGTSMFQRPNNSVNSALPFNIESGHKYAGPSALILLMQKRDDPRWATSNQANRNHTAVLKNATGTLINFMSQYEYQKVVDEKGEPVLKENGKQRVERIKLDQPKQVDAWLFNGEQLRNMPKWEKEPGVVPAAERVEMMLDNSKVQMEHGGDDMLYDKATDTIILPEKEQFASPEQYAAEALHQLVHREIGNALEDQGMIKEELRANLASLFLSKEMNLPYELNYHEGYVNSWAQALKEEPAELFKAASDAQKIVDKIMGFEMQVEEKTEESQEDELAEGQQQNQSANMPEMAQDTPKFNPDKLTKGEVIPHNGTEFKVKAVLKNNIYNMEDLGSKQSFKMSSKDVLFSELIEARNNSQEISAGIEADTAVDETYEAEEQEENNYQMQR